MSKEIDDIIRMCCDVAGSQDMKVAVRKSVVGAAVGGAGALVGGLLAGPVGIAAGATLGGALGMWMTRGSFKPVRQILMELSPMQQKKLYSDVMGVLGSLDWLNAVQLVALVKGDPTMLKKVLGAIQGFITKELQAEVQYGK